MTDDIHTCPLCDLTTTDRTDLYRHLQIGHRKDALASALLATGTGEESRVLTSRTEERDP